MATVVVSVVARTTKKKETTSQLSRRTLERLAKVVPHPRYGSQPIASGEVDDVDEIPKPRSWSKDVYFPETAIRADFRKQNFSTMSHMHWYVDTLRDCRTCNRPFLFFAREQQYWFEVLRFRVEADCDQCVECRASLRTVRRRLKRYGELIGKSELTDEEMLHLASDVAFLWDKCLLENEQVLRRTRNRALRQVPCQLRPAPERQHLHRVEAEEVKAAPRALHEPTALVTFRSR